MVGSEWVREETVILNRAIQIFFFINNGAKRGEVKIRKAMRLSENVLLI